MKKIKIATVLLTSLMAFSASAEVFFCSYEFNPDSPNQPWTTSYPDGDSQSFANAAFACERDGGTSVLLRDSIQ